ncbi:MAG: hypothetical protein ACOVKC_00260 [Brevundimonas sp.]
MGAQDFQNRAKGKTAVEAFARITEQARYEHGHGGYTGTIAEKFSFVMLTVPADEDTGIFIENWINECDKWGDAGCIQTGPDEYVFFGLASS